MLKGKWKKTTNAFLSVSLVGSLLVPTLPMKVSAATTTSDLIISEYVEGSSSNKSIELYNGTGSTVNLEEYSLELYSNGSLSASATLQLSGTLASGATYVLSNSSAIDSLKDKSNFLNSSVINFNGNDPVVLKKSNAVVDSIGQVGSSADFGKDITFVRKSNITTGDKVIDDAFDPTSEWTSYPRDTFDHLGFHGDATPETPEPEGPAEISTIAEARVLTKGDEVTIKGIVTANLKNTVSVQDATGGIAVRPSSLAAKIGDEVTLKGTIDDYNGLAQLNNAVIVEKKENVGAPEPLVVTGAEVTETNESELVTAKNIEILSVQSGSSYANYTVTDGETEFIVRDETNELGLEVGNTYESITGIIQQFKDDYQIIPRSLNDIVIDSSILKPATASPASGTIVGETTVTLSTTTANAEIYYTLDGSDPITNGTLYDSPIHITADTTLKTVVKTQDGKTSEIETYEYKVIENLEIHDIQGAGHTSPFAGETVQGIQGIVTYTFTLNGATYYHIQTPDNLADDNNQTSEAIILYSGGKQWPVKVGDLVAATGEVSEYAIDGYSDRQNTDLKATQINVRDDKGGKVEVVQENFGLPEPIIIDENNLPAEHIDSDELKVFNPDIDAIDFWESLEGMLVEVGTVKAVAPQSHGDLVTVLENAPTNTLHGGLLLEKDNQNANRIQFRLEPNNDARDFEVATGDTFTGPITGVVGYSYQNYKIYTALDDMKAAHVEGEASPEQTTIVKQEDQLTIASYNLENFSNNTSETSNDKASKLARALANDMQSPDIIGVTEVQDNNGEGTGTSDASESYERLISAIKNAGGVEYEYVNIDPVNNQDGGAPNANIRVGFLYNPERVSLTAGAEAGDATTAVGYEDGKLTLNPGRIEPNNDAFKNSRKPLAAQFDFQGESVIVIANHWNSKSGDTPLFGSQQPPVYGSETQRHKIANIVYDFIEDIKTKNPDANVVSLGDFNDYQFSESLKIHEGSLMTNMINKVETQDRYTYVYQGNSQVLDHILVSNNLADQTNVDILHINADFTEMAGRASDHDPVLVQVDLTDENEKPEPIEAEKTYNLQDFKTDKLTIQSPSVLLNLDADSVITEGVWLTGEYAKLQGAGFANTKVTIKPKKAGAIIDFSGIDVKEVIVDEENVKEIRGAENIMDNIKFINGASAKNIEFTNTKGEPIGSPSVPNVNRAPELKKEFSNLRVKEGETVTLALLDYFSDQDNDPLTFVSTKGEVTQQTSILTLNLEVGSHIVAVTANDGDADKTATFSVTVTAADESPEDTYYKDAIGKEGEALKSALHDIIKGNKKLSYSEVWEALKETDEDPNNPKNVILFYSGVSRAKSSNGGNVGQWNREHVWAKSHGNFGTSAGPGTDIHHLRPTDVQVNSSRSNLDFDNGGSSVTNCNECKKTANSWEPPDEVKGDVARMLFYIAVRYEEDDVVDLELNELLNNGSQPYHGKLSVLLQWHEQDPVNEYEENRNNVIEKWQGNRNPFIDHPEWVEEIW